MYHERSKHIDVKLHFVRVVVERDVKVIKVSTTDNAINMLTKSLPTEKFRYCMKLIGMSAGQ